MKKIICVSALSCGVVLLSSSAFAKQNVNEPLPPLTENGKKLEAGFSTLQESLKAEIEKQLPAIDHSKVTVWMAAINAENKAAKDLAEKTKAVARMKGAAGKLRRLEAQQQYGPKTLEDAKDELMRAKAKGEEDPAKEKLLKNAELFLANRQKEMDKLRSNIEKAKIAVKEAEENLPEAIKTAESAKQVHEKAMAAAWKAMDALGLGGILASDQLDGKLAPYMVIKAATPRGLAEFAQQSPENGKLIQTLFADKALMIQMLVADGPNSGKYGEAMKIYSDIQKASPKAKEGVFQRLALATALFHATPVKINLPETEGDRTEYVDPVKRYLNYEKWYLAGELQQGFKDLSVWNLAMLVGGNDPDEIYAWGREMLNNFRPDCIPNNGDTTVYVDVVDKEIAYTSSMLKNDMPELYFKQNILANGGICGRRAFFGRFILRAFGVPTTARKQPGHATLAHWHPDGWKTALGGNWGPGNRGNYSSMNRVRSHPYGADVNFLASSQAREDAAGFIRVKRAQWIGALVGEKPVPGFILEFGKKIKSKKSSKKENPVAEKKIGFWNELALQEQKRIIAGMDVNFGRSKNNASVELKKPAATGEVTVNDKGVITIPSAACSNPAESTKKLFGGAVKDLVVFMKNKSGETLLHLSRYSTLNDTFEYTFDAPKGGTYQLVASVVTPKPNQHLFAAANGGTDVEMALPYTVGMWDKTAPVEIELAQGKNVLTFHGPARVTMGHFTLMPVK